LPVGISFHYLQRFDTVNLKNQEITMALRSQTQRTLLGGFVVSICCCGLVGIYCLLVGAFDDVAARILLTTTAVGGASILALANVIPWESRRWHPIGPCGLAAVCLGLLLALVGILKSDWGEPEWFYKLMSICCVSAVAISHIGLLSLARLTLKFEKVRILTVLVIIALAAQISWSIVAETDHEFWYRLMGVVAILDVCGTIAVPVLHRISAIPAQAGEIAATVSLTCPKCGKPQRIPIGRSQCAHCGLKLRFEVDENPSSE
jgi:hypothetical protein